ncbi:MAG: PSD1 and planctomycete cytochrome C domain-containing protein [Akkermansiaceae bacterium]
MKPPLTKCLAILFSGAALSPSLSAEPSKGEKLFALKVQPLFAEKCLACHGAKGKKIKGGFDMRTRESLLAGGDEFEDKVVIPGKGEESYLYRLTTRTEEDYEMPPKEADKLSEEETWWIRDWINAGAPWPNEQKIVEIQTTYAEGEQVVTSKALDDNWQNRRYESEKLWSYRPLKVSNVPQGSHPVDYFIDRSLNSKKLSPAPKAAPKELIRRLTFGLTGLPPTPDQASRFESAYPRDPGKAIETIAGQLMATPQYGEHFGLRWLDVSRYADSAGFANDYYRPHAWRYRDYVVRSFNQDKPFDQFVREQIAGDELESKSPESLIATGFLRMGPWEQTAMSVFAETRQFWLDDVTDTVGQAFLAHPMQCAKCHDHKFDPVPTRDYYRMMAVFSTTQPVEADVPFQKNENKNQFAQRDQAIKDKRAKTRNGRHEAVVADCTKPWTHGVYTGKTIQRKNVAGRIKPTNRPWAGGILEQDTILTGGSIYARGEPVQPGALSAAESLGGMNPKPFPKGQDKRRLALANWITDAKNPLTARVIVNRIWSWHFGKGLAGNPNNFGGTGLAPTHPELLDYLAGWFIENGWSIKKLNQLIVTSQAYQRSSRHPDLKTLEKLDHGHKLYATFQPRRLTAEELRDAMLAVSGELNPEVGGLPARPDINWEVATQPLLIMGGIASVYQPDPLPEQRNRRSLYAEKLRNLRDPFFEAFNQPGSSNSCEARETSTVAPQALTLMNTGEMQDRALAFAHRLVSKGGSDPQVIDQAFRLALGRLPSKTERQTFLDEWTEVTKEEAKIKPKKKEFPTSIKRIVREEKTGELKTITDQLPIYKTYKHDLQRSETDARTRGLSHLCLILFNLNEFSYLD